MLIDSNLVSLDGVSIASEATGTAVGLTSFLKPGREEPVPVSVRLTEAAAGGTSLTLKLQQCATEDGSFEDVPGSSLTLAAADLVTGRNLGWRFLPPGVTQPWIRVVATPEGSFSAGKLFAAVVREDELPYEEGMYIDKGRVLA